MIREQTEQGFTLLEVIIAISILTFGILAVASMQVSSIRGNSFAWGTSEASTLAVDRIEKLMELPYDDSQLSQGSHPPTPQGRYNISWNVFDDMIISGTKTVVVTVAWTDRGDPKDVNMSFTLGRVD